MATCVMCDEATLHSTQITVSLLELLKGELILYMFLVSMCTIIIDCMVIVLLYIHVKTCPTVSLFAISLLVAILMACGIAGKQILKLHKRYKSSKGETHEYLIEAQLLHI